MLIGQMRHVLIAQQQSADGSWASVASFFAAIAPVGDAMTTILAERVTHKIITRFREDIQTGMRLTKGARLWRVRAVRDPDETAEFLEILAEEEKWLGA